VIAALVTPAPLQVTVFVLVGLAATAVALCRNVLRQVVLNGIYGLLLTICFVVLQAPDVALSMLVVSTVAYPLIVLVAVARVRTRRSRRGP
jgi:energy-converting hydrogenase B subunit D